MLDNKTKKNIDDCKNILVGIVPNPISQVEQITIALIYKFMDDMDKESVEKFKGKPKFFTGKFAKYGWNKLFDPGLGGQEMLALYSEALEKMSLNADIPELFRNIFKNAYLPYRNPATLKLFLKHISEFHYSHSEKLGDAFEYLLSILGSQGDAGQFRTPRHIIEFITACVAPQKGETILDPACGTAGFLLSAYKYILSQNTDTTSSPHSKPGNKLKPDERKKLAGNLAGYDISPDMVRLSLANMYLHGFTTPRIYEYDTLSSEDRWQETYDVILANPPFMTPKGGIRPHKKFGVQANKAEVLFTDYIAEHLNTNGRAGIIVPNGIVATSQTAYKQLRKMLVEDSLIAVVSLPAGVFQPYSGVKTSVLLLDKKLAKKTDKILFLKIENDGYDLGAQRREIEKNDLPEALRIYTLYKEHLINETPVGELPAQATLVEKKKVLENRDVILSAERYFKPEESFTKFKLVKLGDERLFTIESGGTPSSDISEYWNGTVNWATLKDLPATDFVTIIQETERKISELGLKKSSAKVLPVNSIIVSSRATIGRIAINKVPMATNQGFKNIVIKSFDEAIPEYIAYVLTAKVEEMNHKATGSTFKEISKSNFSELIIPLPPPEIQQQIVAEIEGYQKIIDGAKQIVNNYKPTIKINPEWEMVELGEVCEINPAKSELKQIEKNILVSFVPMADLNENDISFEAKQEKTLNEVFGSYTYFAENDVLIAKVTPCFENGKAGIAKNLKNKLGFGSSEFFVLRANSKTLSEWIYFNIKSDRFISEGKKRMTGTSGLQRIPREFISSFKIPLPTISEQKKIVKEFLYEIELINASKRLIELFKQKIKDKINEVWGVKEQ